MVGGAAFKIGQNVQKILISRANMANMKGSVLEK